MSNTISKLGVFTSGGDAPGMNAAIRAVVRASIFYKKEIFGIMRGYEGMIDGEIVKLGARSVGNIIQRGGTILKSARSDAFRTPQGRERAFQNLKKNGIDGLIAIGGNGTFNGLHVFHEEFGIPSICIPGTIDNDLPGSDFTIGFDTATNTAVEAIDRIRDTALSHNRLFFVEVMGRHSGSIGLNSGVAGGAVGIIIPEEVMTLEELFSKLDEGGKTNKKSSLIVVAEGSKLGGALELSKKFAERNNYFDIKVTILGHLQRGGPPTYFDRVLASKMGVASVEGLLNGQKDVMVGYKDNQVVFNPYDFIINKSHDMDTELLRISKILSI
jgi:6-phosphofructokinase 1